jgi:hypothetical protein
MKGLGLGLIVGGWMIAVASLVGSDAVAVRLAAGLIGFATSLAGIGTLNNAHVANVFWKARGQ